MIFVTVGTEQYPFDRMMQWVELLLSEGIIQEEVIVQYGSCTYLPEGARVYKRLSETVFQEKIQAARIIISHCGEGTMLLLDSLQKPYILVPRCYTYREHVDNHQVEMALVLASMDVPVAWSPGDLVRFIAKPTLASLSDISELSARSVCASLHRYFSPTSTIQSQEYAARS